MPVPAAQPRMLPTPEQCAVLAASLVSSRGRTAIAERGNFRFALPGGRSPRAMLQKLVETTLARPDRLDWSRVEVFFVDERALPPEHADSNFRMVDEALVQPLGSAAPRVHRMKGEAADLEAAAAEYAALLETPLDLVLLGIGEDGHVASLFPGSPLLVESQARVAVVRDSPKPPPTRLTLLPRALREARDVIGLAIGLDKAEAFRRLYDEQDAEGVPARVCPGATWLCDEAAGLLQLREHEQRFDARSRELRERAGD
jgi:6-phosphogluconolactonase